MPMQNWYCENIDCRVEIYLGGTTVNLQNCPGCGRMGRNKGKK